MSAYLPIRRCVRPGRLTLIAAALLAAASLSAQPPPGPPRAQKVETARIAESTIRDTLHFVGSLEPWREVRVSARIDGLLTVAPPEEGTRVAKGDVLFELDSRADRIALERAQAELGIAQADLERLRAGSLPEELEQARREVEAAEARLAAARDEWDRLRSLAGSGAIAETEAIRAQSAFNVAESDLARFKAALERVERGSRPEEIAGAEAEVQARRAAVNDIRRRLDDHVEHAPVDGVVVERLREGGEWTDQGADVVTLLVLNPMKLRIEVPQTHLASVRVGREASIDIDGLPGRTFPAVVESVVPRAAAQTRNFPVLLRVDDPDGVLASGMFARVDLTVADPRPALSVPREALRYIGSRLFVYRLEPAPDQAAPLIAHEIEVRVTHEYPQSVAIEPIVKGALAAGDEIVRAGHSRLRDGAAVERLPPPSPPGAG